MIFDGKAFAREIEEQVRVKVSKMVTRPKIVSIMVGDDPASALYTKLKKAAALRCGIDFLIEKLDARIQTPVLIQKIREIGAREDVSGVMVQLPIPGLQGVTLKDILAAIPLEKDVDGLRWEESGVKPATVRAVLSILDNIEKSTTYDLRSKTYVVLGARGAVGRPLVHFLKERGVEVSEIEWDTPREQVESRLSRGEVIVSCVGKAGLVTGEMMKEGVIAIDVGMSQNTQKTKESKNQSTVVGDMMREVYQKASVAVPVPGGVGPVTIASLMENVVDSFLR